MDDAQLTERVELIVEAEPRVPIDATREAHRCTIEAMWAEGPGYGGLRVSASPEIVSGYTTPGQYVTLGTDEVAPRFLVIANGPDRAADDGVLEFLVDRETTLGRALEPLEAGDALSMSVPEGPGFPVEDARDRHALCFVTGAGIASIRPAVQHWLDRPDAAPTELTIYYGESSPDDFAYEEELYQWTQRTVRVFRCWETLDDEERDDGFRYVQQAFEVDDPDLHDAVVFIAGAPPMKRIVADLLLRRGVPFDKIATNVGTRSPASDPA